jgi:hypothetical protein
MKNTFVLFDLCFHALYCDKLKIYLDIFSPHPGFALWLHIYDFYNKSCNKIFYINKTNSATLTLDILVE